MTLREPLKPLATQSRSFASMAFLILHPPKNCSVIVQSFQEILRRTDLSIIRKCFILLCNKGSFTIWGCSSVGRAREWHSRGQGFDPPQLHYRQTFQNSDDPKSIPTYREGRGFSAAGLSLRLISLWLRSASHNTNPNLIKLATLSRFQTLTRLDYRDPLQLNEE